MEQKIDFVIPWVDGNDPEWRKDKNFHWAKENGLNMEDGNNEARFRDWGNLQYWFRAVEKFAPWVNHIYFVTYGHVPKWLNLEHPKLTVVKHEDYIPEECLPVFSANPIEINFHRIEELSEHFIYFNDDMFLTDYVTPDDFFVHGKPREMALLYPLTNNVSNDTFVHFLLTMTGIINGFFNKKKCIKQNIRKWFAPCYGKFLLGNILQYRYHSVSGLIIPHVPSALRKSTMNEVWENNQHKLEEVSRHKFRKPDDVTQYLFRYWEIMSGEFEPTNIFKYSGEFFVDDNKNTELYQAILEQKYKMICINDSTELNDFENIKMEVNRCFCKILNEPCLFEKYRNE